MRAHARRRLELLGVEHAFDTCAPAGVSFVTSRAFSRSVTGWPDLAHRAALVRGLLAGNEVALARFLDDGHSPVDDGIVERLHVRAAMTRKHALCAGSDACSERAAVASTVLGCCALVAGNPVAYLADVLPRQSRRLRLEAVPALGPADWQRSRASS